MRIRLFERHTAMARYGEHDKQCAYITAGKRHHPISDNTRALARLLYSGYGMVSILEAF